MNNFQVNWGILIPFLDLTLIIIRVSVIPIADPAFFQFRRCRFLLRKVFILPVIESATTKTH